jgi:hypothetical protein
MLQVFLYKDMKYLQQTKTHVFIYLLGEKHDGGLKALELMPSPLQLIPAGRRPIFKRIGS